MSGVRVSPSAFVSTMYYSTILIIPGINSKDFFLHKNGLLPESARERGLATSDENRRAVGMPNPVRDKNEGTDRGGGTTPIPL